MIGDVPIRRPPEARRTKFRFTPKEGDPRCLTEYAAQVVWTYRLHIYLAIVVTLLLLEVVYNWPIPKR